MSRLVRIPLDLEEANAFVERHHRRLGKVRGHKFSIGAVLNDHVVGVVVVGRPNARVLQDGLTLEITRLATDGTKNACSFLEGAACRAAFALGYRRVITYIARSEQGTSLRAAGFRLVGEVTGRSWDCPSRPRVDKHQIEPRLRFERGAAA